MSAPVNTSHSSRIKRILGEEETLTSEAHGLEGTEYE